MAKKGRYIYEWPRPMVTVDAAVFRIVKKDTQILLIKRGHQPYKDCWALPGGFIEMDEELEDAAVRELKEETGLADIKLEQLRTYGTVGRDPRGRQISVVFWGIAKGEETPALSNESKNGGELKAGDDAAEAKWFFIKKLPVKMGFDHRKIIQDAIRVRRVKGKERRVKER
jgi:8-oxo-dGTP diphosphatase